MSASHARWVLTALLAFALLLRLWAAVGTVVDRPLRADALEYVAYATNLARFGVHSRSLAGITGGDVAPPPDAGRSPGYPFFLRLVLGGSVEPSVLFRVYVAQALLGTATVALTYVCGAALAGIPVALGAALLVAVSPHLVGFGTYLLTETLFAFLLLLGLWAFQRGARASEGGWWLAAGAALAAAALVRPMLQYFPLLLAALAWLALPGGTRRAAGFLLLGIGLYALWPLRNLLVTGTLGNDALLRNFIHHGMYPGFLHDGIAASFGYPYRFDPGVSEYAGSIPDLLGELLTRVRAAPAEFARWYLVGKPIAFWSWSLVQGTEEILVYPVHRSPLIHAPVMVAIGSAAAVLHWPIVALGLAGTVAVWIPALAATLAPGTLLFARALSVLLLSATAVHMGGAPFPRYSVPLRPELYLLAAALPVWVGRWRAARREGRITPCA